MQEDQEATKRRGAMAIGEPIGGRSGQRLGLRPEDTQQVWQYQTCPQCLGCM
jgi:hypothetical protein